MFPQHLNLFIVVQVLRYSIAKESKPSLLGLSALKSRGIQFCVDQLKLGVDRFSKITNGDYTWITENTDQFFEEENNEVTVSDADNDELTDHDTSEDENIDYGQ